ncbi:Uma2 family endonuclease [Flavobacterium sp.]|uniref:Uma2 family endonuclease n=1 Tax=Flavobacterium sp. TaxID=239 RepID=UPI00286DF572|nr:Uma2 family endonuclease [Flavobacterium sp.]
MATVTNFSDLDLTKEYTYSDYLLWQFSERVELIKGFIRQMSPAPNRFHQVVARNITGIFLNAFIKHSCNVYFAPFDVRLPIPSKKKDTTVVQPDICVVCDKSKLDDAGCNGAPELMIEILSPNNSKHDVDTKFKLYEEAGVLEYWIVEPVEKIIFVYTLVNGKYIGLKPQTEGENIQSPLFPDLKIAIIDVFEED